MICCLLTFRPLRHPTNEAQVSDYDVVGFRPGMRAASYSGLWSNIGTHLRPAAFTWSQASRAVVCGYFDAMVDTDLACALESCRDVPS